MRVTGTVADDRRHSRRRIPPRQCRRCGMYLREKPRVQYCSSSCQRIQAMWRKLWNVDNHYLDKLKVIHE